jgi:hypothetical protein
MSSPPTTEVLGWKTVGTPLIGETGDQGNKLRLRGYFYQSKLGGFTPANRQFPCRHLERRDSTLGIGRKILCTVTIVRQRSNQTICIAFAQHSMQLVPAVVPNKNDPVFDLHREAFYGLVCRRGCRGS